MSGVDELRKLKGLVATISLTGDVKSGFSTAFSNMRDWNSRNGFVNVEYRIFDAKLVEAGRDEAAAHAVREGYDFMMQIDADAGPFPQDAMVRLLHRCFVEFPHLGMVGGYAQLRQYPHLPTIDTGTGKWEPIFPLQGVLEVVRTGGHFFVVKVKALKVMQPPWFRTRIPYSPAKAFAELDNFARTTLDGRNPLAEHPEWITLMAAAKAKSPNQHSHVGEDSGFCDRLRSMGIRIGVDTDIITGHITERVIGPKDLKDAISEIKERTLQQLGVLGYEN